jgi:hypothetical protein
MKLHYLLGTRIQIAATHTSVSPGHALNFEVYADVQTFAYLYRLARPNTIPIVLHGGGRPFDLPSTGTVEACAPWN